MPEAPALAGRSHFLHLEMGAGPGLPMRQFGRTGERVSTLAFGGGQRFYQTRGDEEAVRFIVQAAGAGLANEGTGVGGWCSACDDHCWKGQRRCRGRGKRVQRDSVGPWLSLCDLND